MAAVYKQFTAELESAIFKWADPSGSMLKSPTRVSAAGLCMPAIYMCVV